MQVALDLLSPRLLVSAQFGSMDAVNESAMGWWLFNCEGEEVGGDVQI